MMAFFSSLFRAHFKACGVKKKKGMKLISFLSFPFPRCLSSILKLSACSTHQGILIHLPTVIFRDRFSVLSSSMTFSIVLAPNAEKNFPVKT